MSKLKNLIRQLSEDDFQSVFSQLIESNAEKSAFLLKYLKEKQLSDAKIMSELDVNPNAYYTLRSRLNEKIEEYLIKQMESPKTELLRKVSSINETLFTKNRALVVATLKKLEKELIDYDLSYELTIVYKNLKKLHVHTPEHYQYSQAYNKHVAYTLAIDKAEDILADYFKKFGHYFMYPNEELKVELLLLLRELRNLSRLYTSHRLYVYQSCVYFFHYYFVQHLEKSDKLEAPEEVLAKVDTILGTYSASDSTYHHLALVFDFYKMVLHRAGRTPKRGDKHYNDVFEYIQSFLSNYSLYTFPAMILCYSMDEINSFADGFEAINKNKEAFEGFDCDSSDLPKYIVYHCYRAYCYFVAEKYDQSAKILNSLLNVHGIKKYPYTYMDVKLFLALHYCLFDDFELFNQLVGSIQRQIRITQSHTYDHVTLLIKMMKTSLTGSEKSKYVKIKAIASKLNLSQINYFGPTKYLKMSDKLLAQLAS